MISFWMITTRPRHRTSDLGSYYSLLEREPELVLEPSSSSGSSSEPSSSSILLELVLELGLGLGAELELDSVKF